MSSATLYRASGLALLLGAVLGIVGFILGIILFPGNDPHQFLSPLWLPVQLLSFIGPMLLLLGLPAISARQAPRAGWLGFVGFILTFLGGFLLTSTSVVPLLILPWIAQAAPNVAAGNGPPAFFVYFLVAGVLFALGGILLGIATMRAAILPRWAGLLLLIGAVLNLVAVPLNGIIRKPRCFCGDQCAARRCGVSKFACAPLSLAESSQQEDALILRYNKFPRL